MGQQIIDWTVLDEQNVQAIIGHEARRVASSFNGIVEAGDLQQEGLIWAATHPAEVRDYVRRDKPGLLAKRVWSRLMDIARPMAANRPLSLDAMEFMR